MPETNSPRTSNLAEQQARELILHVRKRFWRYIFIVLIMGSYFFYVFKYKVLEYTATATFIVNDQSFITSSLGIENFSDNDNFVRIYELINSAATQKHLIKKFDLLKHYGIDTTKEFHFQRAIEAIRSNIIVSKNSFNAISVTVRDRYRYLPAEMANEIVSYIEKLNQDYFVKNIERKIKLSEAFINHLQNENTTKVRSVDSLISKLIPVILSGKVGEKHSYDLIVQQQKLGEVIALFKSSTDELLKSQQLYTLTVQALNYKDPSLTIIQTAMPAFRSIVYKAMLFSVIAMVAVFLLLVIQGYFYLHNKDLLRLMFTGK